MLLHRASRVHPRSAPTPIFLPGRSTPVGHVTAAGVFKKSVRASLHFLRVPPAVAFDVTTLDDAERAGAQAVEVVDAETRTVYRAPLALLRERGFTVRRGHGDQLALGLAFWRVNGAPSEAEQRAAAEYHQLSLWGAGQ